MPKTIYPLITNEDVFDYLNCHTDLIDDDNSMTDDELDAVIARIVAKSTEGRLRGMIVEALAGDWYFDKVLDVIDDCMYDFVAQCLKEG